MTADDPNGTASMDERKSMPAYRHRRIQHLQRPAEVRRAGALEVLLTVTVAGHRQALALGRGNVAAGFANALTRIHRRHRTLLDRKSTRLNSVTRPSRMP